MVACKHCKLGFYVPSTKGCFRLFNNVVGYKNTPLNGFNEVIDLNKRGFEQVITIPQGANQDGNGALPAGLSMPPWFNGSTPPTCDLSSSSPSTCNNNGTTNPESQLRQVMDGLCSQYIDSIGPMLVIVDIEWSPILNPPVNQNLSNMTLILRWMGSELHSKCKVPIRFGVYGALPGDVPKGSTDVPTGSQGANLWWAPWEPSSQQLLLQGNQLVANAILPYIDVMVPSLYAPFSPYYDTPFVDGTGVDHVGFWTKSVSFILPLAAKYGKPVIPFIGLRYYNPPTPCPTTPQVPPCVPPPPDPNLYKFVESPFFLKMLQTVTDPTYHVEGVVYWDWNGYGGPGFANDGTAVWSTGYPWYVETFNYFK
jgi:hypothetical protein